MIDQFINFFISTAYADAGASAPTQNSFPLMLAFAVFFAFLYFTMLRPQNKRAKEQQNLINNLAKGDEVVTISGLLGRINKVHDRYLSLEIAPNVEVLLQKSAVSNVLPKGTLKSIE